MTRLRIAAVAVLAAAALTAGAAAQQLPNDRAAITHVLNRIAFGTRPGEVDRVQAVGLARYIDQQLNPAAVPDTEADRRTAHLTTTRATAAQIAELDERPLLEARRERRQRAQPDSPDASIRQPATPLPEVQHANLVLLELSEQKVLRAIYSARQLEEVLTDFWFNHFNVDARKGRVRFLVTTYERDAIRSHVLGRFRDLLGATAKSPAMLFYLDNWLSGDAGAAGTPRRRRFGRTSAGRVQPQDRQRRRGLNENYARELMELHTLGVDGGYTQGDVTEVARAFTGWTLMPPLQGGAFRFQPQLHSPGAKIVLGRTIPGGGGIDDGERVLDLLAAHPSTARHVAFRLVQRFVSDTPPEALVARAADRFTGTNGDLREVMRTILTSPEFLGTEWRGAKVKTPLEFVVSAVRAIGADVLNARPLIRTLQEQGMPLYQCQPPTGYANTADAWMNTGALVSRMNFATALAGERVPGIRAGALTAPALALGGPEFQRR